MKYHATLKKMFREILLQLIEGKFGPPSTAVSERIVNLASIQRWSRRTIRAAAVEDIFGSALLPFVKKQAILEPALAAVVHREG